MAGEVSKSATSSIVSRVAAKIFVFVFSRKFGEIINFAFAKFSFSFAKISQNTKLKFV